MGESENVLSRDYSLFLLGQEKSIMGQNFFRQKLRDSHEQKRMCAVFYGSNYLQEIFKGLTLQAEKKKAKQIKFFVNLKICTRNVFQQKNNHAYSSLPNKRTCTPYLILTKLPPCTLLFGTASLSIFLNF